jgi:hypothetical protein
VKTRRVMIKVGSRIGVVSPKVHIKLQSGGLSLA